MSLRNSGSCINKPYVLSQIIALMDSDSKTDEEALIESGCFLWDISLKPELASFIFQSHFLSVATKILLEEHTDRLKEVILGTMSNIVCVREIAKAVSHNNQLRQLIFYSLYSDDPGVLTQVFRLFVSLTADDQINESWIKLLEPEDVLQRVCNQFPIDSLVELALLQIVCESDVLYVFASTLSENLSVYASRLIMNLIWFSDDVLKVLLSKLDFISVLEVVIEERRSKENEKLRFDPSEEMMEALIGIVELLSTHSVCFPALKNEKLIKQLSTIIIQEDEISLIATCAIALANIESEHEGGILTGDKELVSALISHLLFNKVESDTSSICTLLNEITKKLEAEKHREIIEEILSKSVRVVTVLEDSNWEKELVRDFVSNLKQAIEQYKVCYPPEKKEKKDTDDAENVVDTTLELMTKLLTTLQTTNDDDTK